MKAIDVGSGMVRTAPMVSPLSRVKRASGVAKSPERSFLVAVLLVSDRCLLSLASGGRQRSDGSIQLPIRSPAPFRRLSPRVARKAHPHSTARSSAIDCGVSLTAPAKISIFSASDQDRDTDPAAGLGDAPRERFTGPRSGFPEGRKIPDRRS
jgi:hypothetical protein